MLLIEYIINVARIYLNSVILQGYRDNPKINAIAVVKGALEGLYLSSFGYLVSNIQVCPFSEMMNVSPIFLFVQTYHNWDRYHKIQRNITCRKMRKRLPCVAGIRAAPGRPIHIR